MTSATMAPSASLSFVVFVGCFLAFSGFYMAFIGLAFWSSLFWGFAAFMAFIAMGRLGATR